jgi:hypothetical protein
MNDKIFNKPELRTYKKIALILAAFGLLGLLFVFNIRQGSLNLDNSKLREVQQLSSAIPIFPAFTESGTNYSSGYTLANITKYYNSNANYDEVKEFYSDMLAEKGWTLLRESSIGGNGGKELAYQKDDFSIIIFYAGMNSNSGYNYAVNFVWQDSRKQSP